MIGSGSGDQWNLIVSPVATEDQPAVMAVFGADHDQDLDQTKSSNDSTRDSNHAIEREVIDEDGDVLVQTGAKSLLVSSKVLSLASPVFKVMFKSKFREGTTTRSPQHPLELRLSDDDPRALAVLFRIWHFSPERKHLKPDVDLQLELAQLSDKYDCTTSIHIESKHWLQSLAQNDRDVEVWWKSSTAAFLLGHEDEFAAFTAKVALMSSAQALDRAKMYSCLPSSFKELLHRLRTRVLWDMIAEVEAVIDGLRYDTRVFTTQVVICNSCGHHNSSALLRCQKCRKDDHRRQYCTTETRVCLLLAALSSARMWPFTRRLEDSAVEFRSKLKALRQQSQLHHICDGELKCPLQPVGQRLEERIEAVINRCAGLDLRSLTADDDDDDD